MGDVGGYKNGHERINPTNPLEPYQKPAGHHSHRMMVSGANVDALVGVPVEGENGEKVRD